MSSINPNNIDGTYPIAGQDNDSQGFRDNFTNIKNNFTFSKTEIEDLQNNAILKTALAGTTLDNNLNNAQLYGAQIRKFTETREDLGTQVGSVPVSWNDAHFQTLAITGNTTISLSSWPTSGFWTYLVLDVTPSTENLKLTLPATVSVNTSNIQGFSGNAITLPQGNVSYRFEFSTYDGGTTIAIRDLYRNYDASSGFESINVAGNVLASGAILSTLTVNGNVTHAGGTRDTGYQFSAPTANVAVSALPGKSRLVLTPTGAIISFGANVTLPGGNVDGTTFSISSNVATTLSVQASNGTSVDPYGNVQLVAGTSAAYLYYATATKWFKID